MGMLQHIPCAAAILELDWVSVPNSANPVTQLCRAGQVSQVPPACATAAVLQLGWASKCTKPCSLQRLQPCSNWQVITAPTGAPLKNLAQVPGEIVLLGPMDHFLLKTPSGLGEALVCLIRIEHRESGQVQREECVPKEFNVTVKRCSPNLGDKETENVRKY